jgi:hypothetical protein
VSGFLGRRSAQREGGSRTRMTRPLSIALLVLFARLDVTGQPAPLRVVHYDAYLEPNPATGTTAGRVTLTVAPAHDTTETLTLDRGDLEVESVDEEGFTRQFEQRGKTLMVTLPPRSAHLYLRLRGRPVLRRDRSVPWHHAPVSRRRLHTSPVARCLQ